jgi:hypothetical protein
MGTRRRRRLYGWYWTPGQPTSTCACHPGWHQAASPWAELTKQSYVRDCGPAWHQTPGAVIWLNPPCQRAVLNRSSVSPKRRLALYIRVLSKPLALSTGGCWRPLALLRVPLDADPVSPAARDRAFSTSAWFFATGARSPRAAGRNRPDVSPAAPGAQRCSRMHPRPVKASTSG